MDTQEAVGIIDDFRLAVRALVKLVKTEYPEDASIEKILLVWGEALSKDEKESILSALAYDEAVSWPPS